MLLEINDAYGCCRYSFWYLRLPVKCEECSEEMQQVSQGLTDYQWYKDFYCPKCKSLCDWKPYSQRTDDLTTRRKDGQVDRRYSSVLVSWYHYEYNCTNKDCGYRFTEWQKEGTGPTWTEREKF